MLDLLIVGAGGHAKVVIEAVRAAGLGHLVGILDPAPLSPKILGLPVIGNDEGLGRLRSEGFRQRQW